MRATGRLLPILLVFLVPWLTASGAWAVSFRVDFAAEFTSFGNTTGAGESLLEIPADGRITGSYRYSDAPILERPEPPGGPTSALLRTFRDAGTFALVHFANETVRIESLPDGESGTANFVSANDHAFDFRDDPSIEPCTLAFSCGVEDRYTVLYQQGSFIEVWSLLDLRAETEWPLGAPASALLTGTGLEDVPDLTQPAAPEPSFFLWIIREEGSVQVNGRLVALDLVVVPEPSSALLCALGLAGIGRIRRAHRRRRWRPTRAAASRGLAIPRALPALQPARLRAARGARSRGTRPGRALRRLRSRQAEIPRGPVVLGAIGPRRPACPSYPPERQRDPARELAKTYAHLGVDPEHGPAGLERPVNPSADREPLSAAARARLAGPR